MGTPLTGVPTRDLHAALGELIALIAAAKRQLADAGQEWRESSQFDTARDELDAVVAQSAAAADSILEACEQLDQFTDSVPDPDGALKACTMRIFEACTFQDLVAQRVKKVAGLVRDMEQRLVTLLGCLENEAPSSPQRPVAPAEVSLLNGPALSAPSQADIDRLLGD